MKGRHDLRVHGPLPPSFLRNLEELQGFFALWEPDRYERITIVPDQEVEPAPNPSRQGLVLGFSGGVDSCFSVWHHRRGGGHHDLRAGMMVHGFDLPLDRADAFERAAAGSSAILDSVGLPLIRVATNLRELHQRWPDIATVAVASCLRLFQNAYAGGLIAPDCGYDRIDIERAIPVVAPFMSSDPFPILCDTARFTRQDKVRELAQWPEALQHLHVCWEGGDDRNCCTCRKCIHTILAFRAAGVPLPECFERDVTNRQIRWLRNPTPEQTYKLEHVLRTARRTAPGARWVAALAFALFRSHFRNARKNAWKTLRQLLRYAVIAIRGQ
jgi:hypothetical protein